MNEEFEEAILSSQNIDNVKKENMFPNPDDDFLPTADPLLDRMNSAPINI